MPQTAISRVSINLPARVWEALEQLAQEDGISKTEALRRAITTEVLLRRQLWDGARVFLQQADGQVGEVFFTDASLASPPSTSGTPLPKRQLGAPRTPRRSRATPSRSPSGRAAITRHTVPI